jgi:hypothetical protein
MGRKTASNPLVLWECIFCDRQFYAAKASDLGVFGDRYVYEDRPDIIAHVCDDCCDEEEHLHYLISKHHGAWAARRKLSIWQSHVFEGLPFKA